MYAIIRSGGKQHRVEEGRVLLVERLPEEAGSAVEIDQVLLIESDGDVTIGTPTIEGARVIADIEEHGRAKKIIVFKYKSKVRARKKTGHRQSYTKLVIREIVRPGQKATKEAPVRAAEEVEAAEPAAIVEAPPKAPRRRTRKAAPEPVATAEETLTEVVAEAEAAMPEAEAPAEKPAAKPRATRSRAKPASKPADKSADEKKPARRRPTLRRKKETE